MSIASAVTAIPSPAQVMADPEHFAKTFLRILNKDKRLVPFKWNKAQRDFHQHRTGRDLILKARQLGFSTYVQGEMFRRTVTSTRSTITLAHDDDATKKLRLMADRFYDHCRFGDIQPRRELANATLTTYPDFDSEANSGTAGSLAKGRGSTYTDLHGSEVAFWPDADKIISGAMQGGNPNAILESTANGAQGYFYERCMEALHGGGVWKLHFYPWWWDGRYVMPCRQDVKMIYSDDERQLMATYHLIPEQIMWRRYKMLELPHTFFQEYPEDPVTCFLTSGTSYFGDISNVFTAPADVKYNPEHEYVGGIDFGQTVDYTAMPIFDTTTKQQVFILHVKQLPWKEIRQRIRDTYHHWHLASVPAESNSIGTVNIEELQEDIYGVVDGKKVIIDEGLSVIPFETTNESKSSIMSSMHEALHHGGWTLLDDPEQRLELNTFIATQLPSGAWRLAAAGDGHDDIVMADAIALGAPPLQVFI